MLKTYHYKGLTSRNALVTGIYPAHHRHQVDRFLKSRHIRLVRCNLWIPLINQWIHPIRPLDLQGFYIYMSAILKAGKPLYESLQGFRSERSDALTLIIQEMATHVSEGLSLSHSFKHHPTLFSLPIVAFIHQGEQTGDLSLAFHHAKNHLESTERIRRNGLSALRYPCMLALLFIGMLGILISHVIPQLKTFLYQFSGPPPLATRALFQTLSTLQDHGPTWAGIFLSTIGILWGIYHSRYKIHFHAYSLHLPLLGSLLSSHLWVRLAQTHYLLLTSNVDLIQCLHTCIAMQSNLAVRQRLETALQRLSQGQSLTASFRETGLFSPFFLQVLETGEQSDTLTDCFAILEHHYNDQLSHQMKRLTDMIHPCALSIIGVLMIWIVVAIFSPLYDSFALLESP